MPKTLGFLKKHWVLFLIILLGSALRLYDLGEIPVGLHGDEASIGYNAYSLYKTSKDQNGNFLPLAIDQFGDFRPAGYHYIVIPSVMVLGLNELAVRLPAAFFGILTIALFYLFLHEIFKNKLIAAIGMFLLAVSPWHVIISRASSEGVVAAFFAMLGFYLLLLLMRWKRRLAPLLVLSFASFLLSSLFYHSARFFVPAFLIPFLLISFRGYNLPRNLKGYLIGFFVVCVLAFYLVFSIGQGGNRSHDISILNIPGGTMEVKQSQDEDGTQNPLITRFFHNKLYFYDRLFLFSYFQHFDGDFLFVTNGFPLRYRLPWSGNMNLVELPFLVLGFAILLTEGLKKKKYNYLLPVFWILLAAVPAGLTWEDIPNIQRSSFMIYGLLAAVAFGMVEARELLRGRIKIIASAIVLLILAHNVMLFSHYYFSHARIHQPWHRSASVKELVYAVKDLAEQKKVHMTTDGNNNLIHHIFYRKYDPQRFQEIGSPREHDGLVFENISFTGNPCPISGQEGVVMKKSEDVYYVVSMKCELPKNANIIRTINHPDGTPAFRIVELTSEEEFGEYAPVTGV